MNPRLLSPSLSFSQSIDVVSALCEAGCNKTRQGYTRKRILKLAGYSPFGVKNADSLLMLNNRRFA